MIQYYHNNKCTPFLSASQLRHFTNTSTYYHYVNIIYIMLARLLSKRLHLMYRARAGFSSNTPSHDHHDNHDHHDDHGHGHHDYSVHIDKTTPWIKYKSDPKFVCIQGVEETNYKLQPLLDSDPFVHLKNQPFFSFTRLTYNEPWFHEDSHEPYNSGPERGYVNGEDPLQTRSIYSNAIFISLGIFALMFLLLSSSDKHITYGEVTTSNELIARRYVIQSLQDKNEHLNALKNREEALLKEIAGSSQ